MQSKSHLTQLRVLAVLLLVLGLGAMHNPDLAHSAPAAAPAGSMAVHGAAPAEQPVHDDGSMPPHQRWVGACLAVLATLGAALALCCQTLGSTPIDRAGRRRSAPFGRARWVWSPPTPCIHQLCVMRV